MTNENKKDTGRTDKEGKAIHIGDTLKDDNGIEAIVCETVKGYRVAASAEDIKNNLTISLGLFLTTGAKVISK